jgi:hypothetical protein
MGRKGASRQRFALPNPHRPIPPAIFQTVSSRNCGQMPGRHEVVADDTISQPRQRQTCCKAATQSLWTSPKSRGSRVTEWRPLDALVDSSRLAWRPLTMISIRVEKRYGDVTVYSRVTAPSIERALEIAGEGAKVVFPIDGEEFFAFAKENVSVTENLSWNVA